MGEIEENCVKLRKNRKNRGEIKVQVYELSVFSKNRIAKICVVN
jgi:hypothetical protein